MLGRFLTPDPYITQPQDLQNYNRYSYVDNNPLSATDPSGYKKFWRQKWFKQAVIVAAAVYTGGAAAAAFAGSSAEAGIAVATGNYAYIQAASAIVGGMASGAVTGAASGQGINGIARGAAYGGLSGGISYGIGSLQPTLGTFGTATAHGAAQGTLSYAQGGQFSAGFASGFTGKYAGGYGLGGSMLAGGISSKVAGGSFADGALTAGLVHRFNDAMHESLQRESSEIGENPRSAKKYLGDGSFQYETVLEVNVADLSFAGKYLRAASNVFNHLGATLERGTRYFQYGTKYDVVDQIRLTARDQRGNITYQSHVIDYKNTGATTIKVPPGSQPLLESDYRICMGDGLACSR